MPGFLLSILAAALYSVASARLYVTLGRNHSDPRPHDTGRRATLWLVGAAAFIHASVAVSQTGFPYALRLPFFTALSVTGLVIVLVQLLLCLRRQADYLGLAAWPFSAIALLASQTSFKGIPANEEAVRVHVILSVSAYAVLALGALQAILVAIQRHFLSEKRPGGYLRALPPLESTESLLFALIATGFGLLTLSLASGFFYLDDMFAQHLVHKTVLSCLAWLIFAMLLFGRWRFGWRGRRAVHWSLGGFGMLLLAYFGSKLVLELVLLRA